MEMDMEMHKKKEREGETQMKPTIKERWAWFKRLQYDKYSDSASDVREVLLIVAALITAVTFQAGVNPPGGVWQDTTVANHTEDVGNHTAGVLPNSHDNHTAGTAIYASQPAAFYVFLVSNTLALSSAIFVIISLTYKIPFHFELWVSTLAMIVTYGSAVFAVTPKTVQFRYVLFTAAVPFLSRLLWEAYCMWVRPIVHAFRDYFRASKSGK